MLSTLSSVSSIGVSKRDSPSLDTVLGATAVLDVASGVGSGMGVGLSRRVKSLQLEFELSLPREAFDGEVGWATRGLVPVRGVRLRWIVPPPLKNNGVRGALNPPTTPEGVIGGFPPMRKDALWSDFGPPSALP